MISSWNMMGWDSHQKLAYRFLELTPYGSHSQKSFLALMWPDGGGMLQEFKRGQVSTIPII